MEVETILLLIAVGGGFYMAWSIGANDVANAMGTSVGSGALTVKQAVAIAAILEFTGAFFVGSNVSETIRKGIISPELFTGHEMELVYGMIGALLAAAVWLQVASYFGWPVSTTHSIVGSVLGFGVMYGGLRAVNWIVVLSITASWIISPVMSGVISFFLFILLRRLIYFSDDAVKTAKRVTPYLVFVVFLVLTLAMVFKGLKNLNLNLGFFDAFINALGIGLIASVVSYWLVRRIQPVEKKARVLVKQPNAVGKSVKKILQHLDKISGKAHGEVKKQLDSMAIDLRAINEEIKRGSMVERGSSEYNSVQRIFVYLQVLSAAFIAFAHGANDVANAVGPLAAIITILDTNQVTMTADVPLWVLVLGGFGIIVGLATWGWRVMLTIGKKITELTPTRGFVATFSAAVTIVFASKLGIPVSTTHILVGGVLGVGLARGISALNLRVITQIAISWIVTIPAGAVGAIVIYFLFKKIFV